MTTFINIRSTIYKFHPQEIRAAVQKRTRDGNPSNF